VTLVLNEQDLEEKVFGSYLQKDELPAKFMEFPSAVYSMHPFDKVSKDGKTIGVSTWVGYSSNERKFLTLAIIDKEFAEPGTEVTFTWGEEDGGSRKPTVERHKQVELRAMVAAAPYAEVARTAYADSWRSKQTA